MDRKGGPLDAVNKVYFINGLEGGPLRTVNKVPTLFMVGKRYPLEFVNKVHLI